MNEYNPDPEAKKVRYLVSIIYLLVLAFLVVGSYINQPSESPHDIQAIDEEEIIWQKVAP